MILPRCNFAKACWNSIGVTFITTRPILQIFRIIKEKLSVPFMEIIILMTWSIWTTRNDWVFNDIDPQVLACRREILSEFSLVMPRAKPDMVSAMETWVSLL
jgi:hypothetical protein